MKKYRLNQGHRIVIDPGEYYVGKGQLVLSTLLGSCVSACLYDPVSRIVGMNHFLLANRRYSVDLPVMESEAGRYGIHAMELLINQMLKQGAKRKSFVAKVFGGGDVLHQHRKEKDNFFAVGDVNSRFVKDFLKSESIPIVASDLGRDYGRIIHFKAKDYSVYMRKISHKYDKKVAREEHDYWQKSIKEHEQEQQAPAVQYW
jgi:chemotaxis protein CheD